VHPAGCQVAVNGSDLATDCGYVLSSTGGVSAITFTYTNGNSTSGYTAISMFEYHTTLTAAFDVDGTRVSSTGGSPAGVTLTLTGSNDVIAQNINGLSGGASAITGTYTNPADFIAGFGWAGSINTNSGTAPTWTITSNEAGMSAIAFKETSTPTPSMPPVVL